MPRRRNYHSTSNEREERHERHRKYRSRSLSPLENDSKSKHRKHKDKISSRGRSKSNSSEREHHINKEKDRNKRPRHHHRVEEEYDPQRQIKQERDTGLSQQRRERRQNDERRNQTHRQREAEDVDMNFGRPDQNINAQPPPVDKDKPDFKLSGKLTEDTNTFRGVVVNYNEPPEARKPKKKWRLYPFKGDTELPVLHIHRQSAYLVGRDRRVADIPVDHPSCSKQHAAFQFRLTDFKREDGTKGRKVRPYVIDLSSANGTYVNNNKLEGQRYMELFEKDVIKFGYSSREYVILHDKVDTSELLDEDD